MYLRLGDDLPPSSPESFKVTWVSFQTAKTTRPPRPAAVVRNSQNDALADVDSFRRNPLPRRGLSSCSVQDSMKGKRSHREGGCQRCVQICQSSPYLSFRFHNSP